MDAPLFVAVDDQTWVQVSHIAALIDCPLGTRVILQHGQTYVAPVPAKDFLARMVSVS